MYTIKVYGGVKNGSMLS